MSFSVINILNDCTSPWSVGSFIWKQSTGSGGAAYYETTKVPKRQGVFDESVTDNVFGEFLDR
jgi:hypothetical protein